MGKRLKTRVLEFRVSRDDNGRYIPYCDFGPHQGISLRPDICEQRNCNHYIKLYLNGTGRVDEPVKGDCYENGRYR